MEVILGSKNQPKRQAVARAFSDIYPNLDDIEVQGIDVESGVSSHPTSGEESLQGALNRIDNARLARPSADFYVGIEGGLLTVNKRVWEIGWVAIANYEGKTHTSMSAGVEMSGELLGAIKNGKELNDALNDRFNIENIGMSHGFYGLVTDNVVTREQAYTQAIAFALAPFNHPEYFS